MNDSERASQKIKRLNTNPEQFWQGFLKCMVKLEEAYELGFDKALSTQDYNSWPE